MAGIMCALSLEKRGVRSTVFDTVGYYVPVISYLNFSLVLAHSIYVTYVSCWETSLNWVRKKRTISVHVLPLGFSSYYL